MTTDLDHLTRLFECLDKIESSQPWCNHMPRLAGCLLVSPDSVVVHGGKADKVVTYTAPRGYNYNVSVFYNEARTDSSPETYILELRRLGLYDETWHYPETQVTFASVPDVAINELQAEITSLGRSTYLREPCRTWEMPEDQWMLLCDELEASQSLPFTASSIVVPADTIADGEFLLKAIAPDFAALSRALGLEEAYILDYLRPSDAAVVNANWKYRQGKFTEQRISENIAELPSLCIREKNADDAAYHGLRSWAVTRIDLSIGILHTVPECRGKRFAAVIARAMMFMQRRWRDAVISLSKQPLLAWRPTADASRYRVKIAPWSGAVAKYIRPYCHIRLGNVASEKVFEKLGFQVVSLATWLLSYGVTPRLQIRPINANATHEMDEAMYVLQRATTNMHNGCETTAPPCVDLRDLASRGLVFVAHEVKGDGFAGYQDVPYAHKLTNSYDKAVEHVKSYEELGSVVGCVVLLPAETSVEIAHIAVAPELQRKGVGQRLLRFALKTALLHSSVVRATAMLQTEWIEEWLCRNGFLPGKGPTEFVLGAPSE